MIVYICNILCDTTIPLQVEKKPQLNQIKTKYCDRTFNLYCIHYLGAKQGYFVRHSD